MKRPGKHTLRNVHSAARAARTSTASTFPLPERPAIYALQVCVMPNGEILCDGFTIGWTVRFGKYLTAELAP